MKKSLLVIAVGVGVGYILGARAGRERYDLIVEKVSGVWEDPRVARVRREANRYAREQAPILRDKAQAVAKAAPGVVAERAKATAARARGVADRTVSTARDVADRTTAAASSAATSAAAKVGEARDSVLSTDDDSDDE
jgi:sRNA-binding protein